MVNEQEIDLSKFKEPKTRVGSVVPVRIKNELARRAKKNNQTVSAYISDKMVGVCLNEDQIKELQKENEELQRELVETQEQNQNLLWELQKIQEQPLADSKADEKLQYWQEIAEELSKEIEEAKKHLQNLDFEEDGEDFDTEDSSLLELVKIFVEQVVESCELKENIEK